MKIFVTVLLLAGLAMADISLDDATKPIQIKDSDYYPAVIGGRITNGNAAGVGQFPWQCGLFLNMPNGGQSFCGGSLISNRWVMTAAHCTQGISSVTVLMGAVSRTGNDAGQVKVTVDRSNVIIHANYNSAAISDDISLIRLPYAVGFTNNIKAAALPSNNYNSYAGNQGVASGWGKTSDNSGVASALRWVQVPVIDNNRCKQTFGSYIRDSNICTDGANGRSICNGDSGGPLVISGTNLVVGISSFVSGNGCTVGAPASFTRVAYYRSWINSHTGI